MIGKRIVLLAVVMPIVAKEYRVPVRNARNTHQDCSGAIELHTSRCYRGEPVTFICHFRAPRHAVADVKLLWSDDEQDLYIYPHPHVTDAQDMRTWSWSGVWYPRKAGVQALPQLWVSYTYTRRRKGRSGMAGSIWGGVAREQKDMQIPRSDLITVMELPEDAQHADAIGAFGTCQWTHAPDQIEVGTTYEIGLQIAGAGNFPYIQSPQLQTDEGVRCFHVGDTMEHPVHAYQKTFTYAIYATAPGTYIIDLAGWRAYNPESHEMQVLHPGVVKVHAHGPPQNASDAQETPLPDPEEAKEQEPTDVSSVTRFRTLAIPSQVLVFLVVLPITIASARLLGYIVRWHRSRSARERAVKRAFKQARKIIVRSDNAYHLYRSFMHVFHALARDTHMEEEIVLQHIGRFMPEHIDAWDTFWSHILEQAFHPDAGYVDQRLAQQARWWIDTLYTRWKRLRQQPYEDTDKE